jgi:hypothetical protein
MVLFFLVACRILVELDPYVVSLFLVFVSWAGLLPCPLVSNLGRILTFSSSSAFQKKS